MQPTKYPTSSGNPYTVPRGNKCFCCSKPDHISNQCPERKCQTVNLATHAGEREEPEGELYKDNEDIKQEEEGHIQTKDYL